MTNVRTPIAPTVDEDRLEHVRSMANVVESGLDPVGQKLHGQYFTSMAVARVLAALSLRPGCQDVIDPMAGHGALLDATLERATRQGIPIRQVAAIEIDPALAEACRARVEVWQDHGIVSETKVHAANAFDPETIRRLQSGGFDLVIGNPPYVRYQSTANGRSKPGQRASVVREALDAIAAERAPASERGLWQTLARAYSGLADLSVPAWLLSGLLVKPGGVLALVVPATWRSRNYADVIQYLMQRCFRLERVVADGRAKWFSSALVRTELIVATRLATTKTVVSLRLRPDSPRQVVDAETTEAAADDRSLVGRAFPTPDPELAFAQWMEVANPAHRDGIRLRRIPPGKIGLGANGSRPAWIRALEGVSGPDLFTPGAAPADEVSAPDELADLIPAGTHLQTLSGLGIEVGQGLRTGCNEFFYADFCGRAGAGCSSVRMSSVLGGDMIDVPDEVLHTVLRRQSELAAFASGKRLTGRVLDFSRFVLPEDLETVTRYRNSYTALNEPLPRVMSPKLAAFVRRAGTTKYGQMERPVADLSAVRTNARPGSAKITPRFWYMLPSFARRHRPDALVARVNTGTPVAYVNRSNPIVIDANFSTLWWAKPMRSSRVIVALLNSTWARTCLEAMGTVLGGGALKIEAAHLRRLPLPALTEEALTALASQKDSQDIDRILFSALLGHALTTRELRTYQGRVGEIGERLKAQRQPN